MCSAVVELPLTLRSVGSPGDRLDDHRPAIGVGRNIKLKCLLSVHVGVKGGAATCQKDEGGIDVNL